MSDNFDLPPMDDAVPTPPGVPEPDQPEEAPKSVTGSTLGDAALALLSASQFVPWNVHCQPHPTAPGMYVFFVGSATGVDTYYAPEEFIRDLAHLLLKTIGDRPDTLVIADLNDLTKLPPSGGLLGPNGGPASS